MSNVERIPGDSWLEKLLAMAVVIVLLVALTEAFDWNWFGGFGGSVVARQTSSYDATFPRDGRSQMPYRWVDELDHDDMYMVIETLEAPLEAVLPIKGNREVSRRVFLCMSVAEADAVVDHAAMGSRVEVFKAPVNLRGDNDSLRVWDGIAADYLRGTLRMMSEK